MNQISVSVNVKSTKNKSRNDSMNMSAILTNKVQLQLAQQLPRFVSGYRNSQKMKTININKGLISQGVKNRTIHKILQSSIKQAIKIQQNSQFYRKQKQTKNKGTKKIYKIKHPPNYHVNAHQNQDQSYNGNESNLNNKSKRSLKSYPPKILNILYRQNIKNYNPYTTVLCELQQSKISEEQKNNIRKLCYIGIAKNYFQGKKYVQLPKYSRVGVLIRTYMVDVMRGYLQQKVQNQPHCAYVRINQTALSFNPYNRPKQLQQSISKKHYSQIIHGANRLIQLQYERYKKSNFQLTNSYTYSQLILYALIIVIIVCIVIWSPQNQSLLAYGGLLSILLITLGGMGIAWKECKNNLSKICAPNNLTSRIVELLKVYFKSVSDEMLTWKVGTDFYWIQIENIKLKRKMQQDQ